MNLREENEMLKKQLYEEYKQRNDRFLTIDSLMDNKKNHMDHLTFIIKEREAELFQLYLTLVFMFTCSVLLIALLDVRYAIGFASSVLALFLIFAVYKWG